MIRTRINLVRILGLGGLRMEVSLASYLIECRMKSKIFFFFFKLLLTNQYGKVYGYDDDVLVK